MKKIILSVTTDGSGDGTATGSALNGAFLFGVYWNKGTCADGVDVTLATVNAVGAATHLTLTDANTSGWYYPRKTTHDSTGGALADYIYPLLMGQPKLTIAQGGDTKTGSLILFVLDD